VDISIYFFVASCTFKIRKICTCQHLTIVKDALFMLQYMQYSNRHTHDRVFAHFLTKEVFVIKKIFIIIVVLLLAAAIGAWAFYSYNLSAVSDSSEKIVFDIKKGETVPTIAHNLKENGLIKNEQFVRLYLRMKKIDNLQAATYELSPSMDLDTIIDYLVSGKNIEPDAFMLTVKEGLNMRGVAKVIAENTVHEEADVFALLQNETYIDSLINRYWFMTAEIKNADIYYPLEGYLFPDTYQISSKDITLEDLFDVLLQGMETVLDQYKDPIGRSSYSAHELLALASMVELEGTNAENRNLIAGVFYNRLNDGWSLGSDVSTYYAFKIDMSSSRDLTESELNKYNPYNTRGPEMIGKLPVGPIAGPGRESIDAVMTAKNTEYYYFVADNTGEVFFSKTEREHQQIILSIKNSGKWIF